MARTGKASSTTAYSTVSSAPPSFTELRLSQPASRRLRRHHRLYVRRSAATASAAKNFLKSKGLQWNEVRIDLDPAERERMLARARRTSVPQIFIGETHVGGYDDMMALHRAGKFEALLPGAAA